MGGSCSEGNLTIRKSEFSFQFVWLQAPEIVAWLRSLTELTVHNSSDDLMDLAI